VLVKDIRPGFSSSSPLNFTDVNGTLFFSANDGTNGYELWKSDGTSAGTVLVKNVQPGSASADPRQLTSFNDRLFFSADDGMNGRELWISNGTAAGTMLFKDINTVKNLSSIGNVTEVLPMTVPTAESFGRVTGRAVARCWSRIFDLVPPAVIPLISPK